MTFIHTHTRIQVTKIFDVQLAIIYLYGTVVYLENVVTVKGIPREREVECGDVGIGEESAYGNHPDGCM